MANQYVNKVVQSNGTTLIDITDTTATASDVASGKYFYLASGEKVQGSASGGSGDGYVWQDAQGYVHLSDEEGTHVTVESLSVTQNGTYTAPTGKAYSPVSVSVSGGGGGTSVEPKQVNFIDYDGTVLYAYTGAEANALAELPSNPTHTGLTAQGWNWTLTQIKTQLTSLPNAPIWVGQMYVTTSGATEIDVAFVDPLRLSPYLRCAVNGSISIDWGDNTTPSTLTGSSLSTNLSTRHIYASTGNYTIKISVNSGSWAVYSSSSYPLLNANASTTYANYVYSRCVKSIRLGTNIGSLSNYAFSSCISLEAITIPNYLTSMGTYMFSKCYSLKYAVLPSGIDSLPGYTYQNCSSLKIAAMPYGITSIGNSAFYYCYSLEHTTIPASVTTFGNNVFNSCYLLKTAAVPNSVTSLDTSSTMCGNCYSLEYATLPDTLTSMGNQMFNSCYSLTSITVPSTVTSIGNNAFSSCYGMLEYHFKPTNPPTLGTSVFSSIQANCVIYVPSASVTAYKNHSSWSSYSSYIQGE